VMENYQFLELTLSLKKEWPASLRQACRTGASTGHKYPVMAKSTRYGADERFFISSLGKAVPCALIGEKTGNLYFFSVFSRLEGHDGSFRY